jgi:hypothetical protein
MSAMPCTTVARQLAAYHDDELTMAERVQVASHLRECSRCAAEAQSLQIIGAGLRAEARRRRGGLPDPAVLRDGIVGRLQAERAVSLPARVSSLFEDFHLVWAGLSAGAAAVACVALVAAIWAFSMPQPAELPFPVPGSDGNPVALDLRMRLPRVSEDIVLPDVTVPGEEDLVFALAAVVTREGRIARPEVLVSNHADRDVDLLMNAIQAMRLQPASLQGNPVAVNFVWLFTYTTVRAKRNG